MQNKKIGVVGLGIMGRGMAQNFLKNGCQVFVWNRTAEVAQDLVKEGATAVSTPKEVAQQADVLFEVTANDESSKSVWLGDDGILAGANHQTIVIASATLSAAWADELIKKCAEEKVSFIDAPLTGGRIGAETGQLTLLCGGDEATLDSLRPTFKAITKKVLYFGPAGHGMRYKLLLNFVQATHIVAFSQAMAIAKNHSMDLRKVGEALADRPGGVSTEIANRSYFTKPNPITFSMEWLAKDLSYAQQFAGKVDATLLDDVLKLYQQALDEGLGQEDWATISQLLERTDRN